MLFAFLIRLILRVTVPMTAEKNDNNDQGSIDYQVLYDKYIEKSIKNIMLSYRGVVSFFFAMCIKIS